MKRIRMFLEQKYLRYMILCTIAVDVLFGYLVKHVGMFGTPMALALMYLANIVVLLAVYRFWIVPVFECDETGFIVYGISPFNKDRCKWEQAEYVCFKDMEVKKGKLREFLLLHYILPDGRHKTNMVPMYMVALRSKVKEEFMDMMKKIGIELKCQPGL